MNIVKILFFIAAATTMTSAAAAKPSQNVTVSSLQQKHVKQLVQSGKRVCALPAATGSRLCIDPRLGHMFIRGTVTRPTANLGVNVDYAAAQAKLAAVDAMRATRSSSNFRRVASR
jgi:hypothetical protein